MERALGYDSEDSVSFVTRVLTLNLVARGY